MCVDDESINDNPELWWACQAIIYWMSSCHGGQRSACNVRSARKQNMQYVMCVYYATLWSSEICEGAK
jgi:hypothetical protein